MADSFGWSYEPVFMTKWLLTNEYDVDNSEYDEHIYFNYACNKHYGYIHQFEKTRITIKFVAYRLIAPNGREFFKQRRTK
jgi:hypothetical protein